MAVTTSQVKPATIVIFGASGDLTKRKILPAIANLAKANSISPKNHIVGIARTPLSDDGFRDLIIDSTKNLESDTLSSIIKQSTYITGEYDDFKTFRKLIEFFDGNKELTEGNILYYLATPPTVFATIAKSLKANSLTEGTNNSFVRVIIEKPFGSDLKSAIELDKSLHDAFREEQIYRIDHYLGKETVQNVLALRFTNAILEPIWSRRYVDNIQITVAESLGVEHRGSYYESEGALRDIVQNHVMQVLALTLMEPPVSFEANSIRDEKVKLLKSIEIFDPEIIGDVVVRGQYKRGRIDGVEVPGYREEPGVNPNSKTETFVAMELAVDNWRWANTPIYVRTGKRLKSRSTLVALTFQRVPHLPIPEKSARALKQDRLILRIQPDEGIELHFGVKVPGAGFTVKDAFMNFSYTQEFGGPQPEAYERLILDALSGDPTLFIRTDEVLQAWKIVDPILRAFEENTPPLSFYEAGSYGPLEADRLLLAKQKSWVNLWGK